MSFRTKAAAFTKRASLGDITGFNESREGWRELNRTGGPERVVGLPSNVSSQELEERLKDIDAQQKLMNPKLVGLASGLVGAGVGHAMLPRNTKHRGLIIGGIGAGLGLGSAAGNAAGRALTDATTKPWLRKKIEEKKREGEKKASLAEYSTLFDHIEEGKFGPHVKEALAGVCEAMSSSLQSAQATKQADAPTEADARQARLNELLRKM